MGELLVFFGSGREAVPAHAFVWKKRRQKGG